eukprot:CAMPEP_0170555118 /NCGR_PEP_ID=MMETSP0211-20121228/13002_1 /TAXON_ID=311385 /ORGANISM="Pseudokeronopsis sp., Strain OXSARD2" /LENGTH=53 /DNA_ID=CAMNT_0010864717 /DNA_START=289 /DNA_END=446 /DNA_ORIENTATION=+
MESVREKNLMARPGLASIANMTCAGDVLRDLKFRRTTDMKKNKFSLRERITLT